MPDRPLRARASRAAARRGADGELPRVYREHVGAVYAFFAYSVSRDHAEDLTAATFERVVKAWRGYDPARAGERTWILAIARNQLTDFFRRQSHRGAVSTDEHPLLVDALGGEDPLERWLDRDEVRSWLAALGERERGVLALRYGADLPGREIAELMGLSEGNVHQIISRSLRSLRESAVRTPT